MRIFVVAVRLPDFAFQSMHGEIHLAESDRLCDPFRPVNADLTVPVQPVVMDKFGTLDKHTARAARLGPEFVLQTAGESRQSVLRERWV